MLIRRERPGDAAAVDAVHRSAFALEFANANVDRPPHPTAPAADPPEVGLVRLLRDNSGWMPTLSMVAESHDDIVGHVCLTRAGIGPFPVLALGPIGVRTDAQAGGVGSALMHAALGAADALDEPLVGLLGHLDYYPRFGFVPGTRLGIVPNRPEWTSHFQVRPLAAYDPEIKGEFRYADPFYCPASP
ncbi:GNAT family N-acetyltransferase [Nocardia sp. SYP-A9097]|uniref:GNAT family N-acetyltransferase n=1 Tax=Nocardia sp. SYP-A9097 TaxID=2663237 RepID=UPI001328464A|nr:N-acetyltransferase [Nocardia sp. SYP-A9097]MRH87168.1 GNAT family N-acetyltransferase [Nocardia sp. SYP-A9097]